MVASKSLERSRRDGFEGLSDRDLLTLVVGNPSTAGSVFRKADTLLAEFVSLANMSRASVPSLSRLGNLRPEQAARLAAAFEIGLRALGPPPGPRNRIMSSRDITQVMGPRLERLAFEQVWVIALDHHNRFLGKRLAAQGGLHGCALRARDVLRIALDLNASSFVLVHNHPSGDVHPSAEDLTVTRTLADSACVLGIPLVDHVIVGSTGYTSFADLGLMKPQAIVPATFPRLPCSGATSSNLIQTSEDELR